MRDYRIELVGKTPLLMHWDNIPWADIMDQWKNDPANKNRSKAGEDRSPAWRWLGCVYHDGERVGIPQENIMRSIMEGGVQVPVPNRGKKTFKAQTQSGMMSVNPLWVLQTKHGNEISWPELEALKEEESFSEQMRAAESHGFSLLVKRARVGKTKHVRVRPEFAAGWRVHGTLRVWDEQITESVLRQILGYAGQYKGLGDWRPGGTTPGPYGIYEATIV